MNFRRSFLILTVTAFICACGQSPGPNTAQTNNATPAAASTPQQLPADTQADLMAQGRKIYMDNCAACHKENGTGGKVTIEGKTINPDDLTSEKIKNFADEKIYRYILNGIEDEGMPAFKDKLSEAEIREVVRFVRIEIQKMAPQIVRKPTPQ